MSVNMRTVSLANGNQQIQLEHNGTNQVLIRDQPLEEPYEHQKRGIINEVSMLQYIPMMDFQAKIAMLFRGAFANRGIQLPLKGTYEVEIELESPRSLQELPLLLVMKSVVDGLNNEIVDDDQFIVACTIEYKLNTAKPLQTKPSDVLSVALFKRTGNNRVLVQSIDDVSLYIVPKQVPMFLDYEHDAQWTFDVDDMRDCIFNALQVDGMNIVVGGPIILTMKFEGSVKDKDLDNMARVYFKLLEKFGLRAEDVYRIDLAKEQKVIGSTQIILS